MMTPAEWLLLVICICWVWLLASAKAEYAAIVKRDPVDEAFEIVMRRHTKKAPPSYVGGWDVITTIEKLENASHVVGQWRRDQQATASTSRVRVQHPFLGTSKGQR